MTHSYRPGSPILEVTTKVQHKQMYLAEDKIHRMAIKNPTLCQFVSLDSPNCIWFKMLNHISDELRISLEKNSEILEKIDPNQELKEFDYVMAPIEEGIYARARILIIQTFNQTKQFVYVHFIDEGYGKWMLSNCLAKMNSKFRSHPWQAFPISLFKFEIKQDYMDDEIIDEEYLVEFLNEELSRIFEEFDIFKVIPVMKKFENNDFEYTKAEIYGLNSVDDKGESILHCLAVEMEQLDLVDIVNRTMFSATHQPLKKLINIYKLTYDEAKEIYRELPVWHKNFIFAHQNIYQLNGINTKDSDWVKEKHSPQIEPLSLRWLQAHCCSDDQQQLMIILDWNSLRSPFEFYAFPLRRTTNGSSKMNIIRHFYELHSNLTKKLDQFYGNSINRKPIEANELVKELLDGKQPFAIYETNDEVSGSSFRRVQVISIRQLRQDCSNEFVRIRYLDIGGSGVVPIAGLLRIHSSHCADPPMCIQLMLNKIAPPYQANSWTPEECKYFKSLIRVDIPTKCYLTIEGEFKGKVEYDTAPYLWPGVFTAMNLQIENENECLEQKMVQAGMASWS